MIFFFNLWIVDGLSVCSFSAINLWVIILDG